MPPARATSTVDRANTRRHRGLVVTDATGTWRRRTIGLMRADLSEAASESWNSARHTNAILANPTQLVPDANSAPEDPRIRCRPTDCMDQQVVSERAATTPPWNRSSRSCSTGSSIDTDRYVSHSSGLNLPRIGDYAVTRYRRDSGPHRGFRADRCRGARSAGVWLTGEERQCPCGLRQRGADIGVGRSWRRPDLPYVFRAWLSKRARCWTRSGLLMRSRSSSAERRTAAASHNSQVCS